MASEFQTLRFSKVNNDTYIPRANQSLAAMVTLNDPAIFVMTDFLHTTPVCIASTASITAANERMIAYGIRLLFVGDQDNNITGLITYNDIWGAQPINYIQEHGGNRDDILVLEMMTRVDAMDSVRMSEVALATVGDVVETFRACGRHHVLVTEDRRERMVIRGLFSITRASQLLQTNIELTARANSFAELEKALSA